jgi:hypothetical protein
MMNTPWFKPLVALIAGLSMGYFLFSDNPAPNLSTSPANQTIDRQSVETVADTSQQLIETEVASLATTAAPLLKNDALINQLYAKIDEQKQQIAALEQSLLQLQQAAEPEPLAEAESLETISMADFEKKIKGAFRDRFKGYAIELNDEQNDEFKKMFEREQKRSTWSAEFENSINEFIRVNDPNGIHYVDEVVCNHMGCRLKVQSSEMEDWQKLYSSMTRQGWFDSMTLVKKSDTPGTMVYYIPKPQTF